MRRGGSAVGLALVVAGVLVLFLTHSSLGSIIKAGKAKGSSVTADIAVGSSEASWINALLTRLGDPHSEANKTSFADWIHKETYGWPPEDQGGVIVNNPLNTGKPEPGSRSYNSGGVQIYPNLSVGLKGTYDTLVNGHYGDILSRLKSGQGLTSGASAGLSTWSNGAYTSV